MRDYGATKSIPEHEGHRRGQSERWGRKDDERLPYCRCPRRIGATMSGMGPRCDCGATRHFGIPPETYWGTFELLTGEDDLDSIIITTGIRDVDVPENVHLIPAGRDLENLDGALGPDHKFFPGVCSDPIKASRAAMIIFSSIRLPACRQPPSGPILRLITLSFRPRHSDSLLQVLRMLRGYPAAIRRGNTKLRAEGNRFGCGYPYPLGPITCRPHWGSFPPGSGPTLRDV